MAMWDVEGLDKPSKRELKEDRSREFNEKQRAFMRSVGENMASLGCILIVLLFVGYIWADMKIQVFSERMLCDAIVSIVFFLLVEHLMSQNGVRCGKLYDEYIEVHNEYLGLRKKVTELGLTFMNVFCDWQIDVEYEFYLRKKCRELKIDYKLYDKICQLSLTELKDRYSADIASKVFALKQIEPVELSGEILMTDGAATSKRGGVGDSAEAYLKKKTRGWLNLTLTIVAGIFSAAIAYMLNDGASWGLVLYTIMKLALLTWRMYKGYSEGAKAYNTVEVKHIQDKMRYLYLYNEFVVKKIYLSLGDKYDLPIEVAQEAESPKENKPS